VFELYDLDHDPDEANNVFAGNPDRAAGMQTQLHAWLTSVVNSLNGKDYA